MLRFGPLTKREGSDFVATTAFCRLAGAVPRKAELEADSAMATEQGGDMRVLIERIAKALVDEPEHVAVQAGGGEHMTILELKVSANDLGKIIGKEGRTARSIRTILSAASAKLKKHYTLKILE